MRDMRIEKNHAHALMIYEPTDIRHFFVLSYSIFLAKTQRCKSITTHLPFEIQHPTIFSKKQFYIARLLILWGEFHKRMFKIPLYWENCPIFNIGTWDLKYQQTNWRRVPTNIDLCIDTGHLMMGSKNKKDAVKRIEEVFADRGGQIKHLHIHENDLISDLHQNPGKQKAKRRVLSKTLIRKIQRGRTYIFEKPS